MYIDEINTTIKQEHLDALNNEFADAIFEFKFDIPERGVVQIGVKDRYTKYIDTINIYLDNDAIEQIKTYFNNLGIKLSFNNTQSSFWASYR